VFLEFHGRAVGEDFEGTQTVEVNGATLAYLEQGQAEPVVFVHGSASDLRTWHHQFAAIGATHRVIVYSRRYARPNQPIPEGADDPMLPHVDDLVNFLRQVDAVPAHLVGHSWGGFVSLLAAIRHPEVVRTLVLMEPPAAPAASHRDRDRAIRYHRSGAGREGLSPRER
jgi:pimeloyl-ACP methyl ester carboxylesterase